tara:strand:+ start:6796 stop:7389 length:594 start_codon:yes stop_codon:yes gene_type:complete
MNKNVFDRLEIEAFRAGITPRTDQSRAWFRRRAQAMRRVNREGIMQSEQLQSTGRTESVVGSMYMFFYDPKHKDTLPYYDQFPLIFVLGDAPGGFLGMNLHYLPPLLRQKLLKALLDLASNDNYNKRTKLMLSYDLLKGSAKYAAFKPTIKHYLTSHVKTRLAKVPAAEWEIAIFLPMAQWKKASATQVYRDSRKMI